jgi:hypothetical protein
MNLALGVSLLMFGIAGVVALIPILLWVHAYRLLVYRMFEDGPLWQDLSKSQRVADVSLHVLSALGILALLIVQALVLSLFCHWVSEPHTLYNHGVAHHIDLDSNWGVAVTVPFATWFVGYDLVTFMKLRSRYLYRPRVVKIKPYCEAA